MADAIKTYTLSNVTVQENGIIRNESGYLIGRLCDDVEFEGQHVRGHALYQQAAYDPSFGDDKECVCGHQYYRHFDTYWAMMPVGCKYCEWREFRAATTKETP